MKYMVIQRAFNNASWLIRFLESGDTEIMELTENYYDEDVTNPFDYNGEEYFWQEWASKELWQEVWIEDSQQNGDDVTKTEFDDFLEAAEFLGEL